MSYPLIFGEILYDQFDDGTRILGGAPFNVAWHLHGFGLSPKILSRIGQDEFGKNIQQEISSWQLDSTLIQHDNGHATGTVNITLHKGQPTFDIVEDVAYDHIQLEDSIPAIIKNPPSIFYHGSLAARQSVSRETLLQLRKITRCPIFVDINLRAPWWDKNTLDQLVAGTTWLKINQDELVLLTDSGKNKNLELKARELLEKYNLKAVIVTMGDKGAFIIDSTDCYSTEPVHVSQIVDAVGAGDGFSAVAIVGLLLGWDFPMILNRAVDFAAKICQQRGAIPTDRDFYNCYKEKWIE